MKAIADYRHCRSNALPELVKDAGFGGKQPGAIISILVSDDLEHLLTSIAGEFHLRQVESADNSMSPLQIVSDITILSPAGPGVMTDFSGLISVV